MLEADEDALDNGFGNSNQFYKADINDPALANASQTHAIFEFTHTYNMHASNSHGENYRLAKSILLSENLPNEMLGMTPLHLTKKMHEEQSSWE